MELHHGFILLVHILREFIKSLPLVTWKVLFQPYESVILFNLIILNNVVDKNDLVEYTVTDGWHKTILVTRGRDFMGPIGIGKRINPVFRREIVFFLTDKWNYIFSYYVLRR